MKKYGLILVVLCVNFVSAQPNRSKDAVRDETDGAIKKKLYVWGEKVDDTSKNALRQPKDVWYSKYTPSVSGFVELKSGEVIDGGLVKRYVYNKASTQTVVINDKKQDNPDGIEYNEIHLTSSNGKTVYKLDELRSYGAYYTIRTYDKNTYVKGIIYLADGSELQGFIKPASWSSPYKGLKYYGKMYYSKNEESNVQFYHSDQIDKVTINDGTVYNKLGDWLITASQFNIAFTDYASANKFDPLAKGEVVMQDGQQLQGRVVLQKGKNKSKALFVNAAENLYLDLTNGDVGSIKVEGKYYIRHKKKFQAFDNLYTQWQKKKELMQGRVVFENGKELSGEIVFTTTSNAVKSYREITGFHLLSKSTRGVAQTFRASSEVDFVEVLDGGRKAKYVVVGRYFVAFDKFYSQLKSNDSKKPEENLQPGYVMLPDGTKMEGKIAGKKYKMTFVDSRDNLQQFSAYQTDKIDYYVQRINGVERKFKPLQGRAKEYGPDHEFVEIIKPFERFSFYKSPNPTNIRKGITKFGGGVINFAADQATTVLAQEVALQNAQRAFDDTGEVGATLEATQKSFDQVKSVQGVVEVGKEGGVFFEEWVILNNSTGQKYVVFKRNEDQQMSKLLSDCPSYSGLTEKESRKLRNVSNLEEAVNFLNICAR